MASNIPTIRQINWLSIVPHLAIMGFLIWVCSFYFPENPVIPGAISYLVLSMGLRVLIPRSHRMGIRMVKAGSFENAIPFFEISYNFFEKNLWLDKYRFITMLSSAKTAYQEMALTNIAFCYGQLGDAEKAKEYYEKTLAEFPDNGQAIAALNLLNAAMDSQNINSDEN